ncbi:GYD domain-containing protein [Bradyrhizobium sp. UFLA 03-164]|uniref:GYD domain-containing protein n=2 Tax=Nitrobacteraceae TaxID=41294 RepID=A0A6P1BUF9_9BRAD|nr:GYD domain-containing protein [Bradyrhizobium oropedii]NEV01905.1 GYD domain-containing protein [Bradyrhizobium uaiense]
MEDDMATFILRIDWTDQGIRNVKEAPKRSRAARELAQKLGVEIKEVYLTSGEHDILLLAEAPLGDSITKLALALSSMGNIRTCTSRAWPEAEWTKLISELP